jgi:putative DNA primase/helicase
LFAVVALSGELAIEWEIVPLKNGSCPGWTADDAKNAALKIFEDWKKAQPQSSRSREHAQILKRVSDFIDVNASSRFLDINWKPGVSRYYGKEEEEPVVRDQAGYFEDNGTDRIFLFTSAGLKAATPGFDFARVLRALEEAGAFTVQGTDEKAKQRRTPDGRNPKLYHIDPAKLDPKP